MMLSMLRCHAVQSPRRLQHLGAISLSVSLATHIIVVALIITAPTAFAVVVTIVVAIMVAIASVVIVPTAAVAASVTISTLALVLLFCWDVSFAPCQNVPMSGVPRSSRICLVLSASF
jgi:hypothetical protein